MANITADILGSSSSWSNWKRNALEGNVFLWGKQLNSDQRSGYFKYPLLPFPASQYQGATMQLYFDHSLYNHTSSSRGETQTTERKWKACWNTSYSNIDTRQQLAAFFWLLFHEREKRENKTVTWFMRQFLKQRH